MLCLHYGYCSDASWQKHCTVAWAARTPWWAFLCQDPSLWLFSGPGVLLPSLAVTSCVFAARAGTRALNALGFHGFLLHFQLLVLGTSSGAGEALTPAVSFVIPAFTEHTVEMNVFWHVLVLGNLKYNKSLLSFSLASLLSCSLPCSDWDSVLSSFPVLSRGREKAVEIFMLLDGHFWLLGQGVADHHSPMAEQDLALFWHPAGHMAELGLAVPRTKSDSQALSLELSSYFRCGVNKGLLSAFPYSSNSRV